MKIEFDKNGKNYLEIANSQDNKIKIVLSTQHPTDKLKKIVNSAEISKEDWINIISSIS